MRPLLIKAQEIVDLPKMVAPLPYLNFLRYFRRKHPRMSLVKILQLAPAEWDALSTQKRGLFHKKRILARIARFSRLQCLRLLLPRLNCKTNMDSTTRLQALQERKRYYRMKREHRQR